MIANSAVAGSCGQNIASPADLDTARRNFRTRSRSASLNQQLAAIAANLNATPIFR